MYIRTGHNGVMWDYQLVAQRESKDYDEKAINNGFVALQFMSGLLDQKCFASYANKALTPKDQISVTVNNKEGGVIKVETFKGPWNPTLADWRTKTQKAKENGVIFWSTKIRN